MVTARAVGRLATLAELASPLLRDGGSARRLEGTPRPRRGGRARAGRRAAGDVARARSRRRRPSAGFEHRHLHLVRKRGPDARGPAAPAGDGEEAPRSDASRLSARAPPARCANGRQRWAPSTRSQTRRAGSARRRPPSTSPPAPPPTGRQVLLVDLDPQCNATVAARPRPRRLTLRRMSALPARPRSPTPPGRPARTTSGSSRPTATSPAPRSSCRASRATSGACATASARSASASR